MAMAVDTAAVAADVGIAVEVGVADVFAEAFHAVAAAERLAKRRYHHHCWKTVSRMGDYR